MRTEIASTQRPAADLLRNVLYIDGAVSGGVGILLLALASPLSDQFGLSVEFLRGVGLLLLPWAIVLVMMANRATIPRTGVQAIVGINMLWAGASFLVLAAGWVDPTGTGVAFVVAQALLVVGFADVQFFGLRRQRRT